MARKSGYHAVCNSRVALGFLVGAPTIPAKGKPTIPAQGARTPSAEKCLSCASTLLLFEVTFL